MHWWIPAWVVYAQVVRISWYGRQQLRITLFLLLLLFSYNFFSLRSWSFCAEVACSCWQAMNALCQKIINLPVLLGHLRQHSLSVHKLSCSHSWSVVLSNAPLFLFMCHSIVVCFIDCHFCRLLLGLLQLLFGCIAACSLSYVPLHHFFHWVIF